MGLSKWSHGPVAGNQKPKNPKLNFFAFMLWEKVGWHRKRAKTDNEKLTHGWLVTSRSTSNLWDIDPTGFIWLPQLTRFSRSFFYLGTPSGVHLFDHLLCLIIQSSIYTLQLQFLQVLTCSLWPSVGSFYVLHLHLSLSLVGTSKLTKLHYTYAWP